jgi:hypothetical protein
MIVCSVHDCFGEQAPASLGVMRQALPKIQAAAKTSTPTPITCSAEESWKKSASIICSLHTDGDTHKTCNKTWLLLYIQTRLFKKHTHLHSTVNAWKQPFKPGG